MRNIRHRQFQTLYKILAEVLKQLVLALITSAYDILYFLDIKSNHYG